jgi:endonuclease/exonuclease/phosphatase family metal-dependent hydrolase
MNSRSPCFQSALLLLALTLCVRVAGAESFRVATYNLESYLDQPTESRPAKLAAAKAKVREGVLILKPDVLAVQEMGSTNALLELRDSLKAEGLDLPYWEHINGFDISIHVAILSRFPFAVRHPHTNDSFLLSGRRFRVSRGFGEVEIQVNANYSFTLIAAHLKSKRTVGQTDEAEMRLEEAKLLRERIDVCFAANPNINLIVLGDFNDTRDSASTKAVIGRGKRKLVDTRPAERNGDNTLSPNPALEPRNVTWTHYYGKADSYSRIDYILISSGMAREWITNETYALTLPNWGVGSDHRPIVAAFDAEDK